MNKQELIEQLADKEHASWARWMEYLFDKCESDSISGGMFISAELRGRWQRQIETPYAELSEQEKQYDREEVEKILPIIEEHAHSEPRNATPLEIIDLRLHRIENTLRDLRETHNSPLQGEK